MADPSPKPPVRPTVLLVEDEAELVTMWRKLLDQDFDIETAATGEEAALLLATRPYDLIVSDHMMPGKLQGLDFLVQAMQQRPASRRLLMTGYMNPDLIARSISVAGLSACLIKPIKVLDLRDEMFAALGSRQS
jgi:response regulator RpfG family c-di-GMP phosphodiesterase